MTYLPLPRHFRGLPDENHVFNKFWTDLKSFGTYKRMCTMAPFLQQMLTCHSSLTWLRQASLCFSWEICHLMFVQSQNWFIGAYAPHSSDFKHSLFWGERPPLRRAGYVSQCWICACLPWCTCNRYSIYIYIDTNIFIITFILIKQIFYIYIYYICCK